MPKALYIAEKPSVAQEFARVLKISGARRDGYLESEDSIVTWCVGHLVTMSYPEKYDIRLKRWSFDTLPFLPEHFLYEVIPDVRKQFETVKMLLNRKDVSVIYVCTDSGREGEYIYRLVAQMAGVQGKDQRRVWIDSQTEEEIQRGIREARSLSDYDNLAASAYLRAKEDYLMGINFSRALSLKYGQQIAAFLKAKYQGISAGRVMTCVLGMVVRREREIRSFVKTSFYRVLAEFTLAGETFEGEWRAVEGSRYYLSPLLYKENGFKKKEDALRLIREIGGEKLQLPEQGQKNPDDSAADSAASFPVADMTARVEKAEKKKELKNPPLLFNLAELQNVCSKLFKISPDETLRIVQDLYEKKLVTYPRTDARVLSTAVAKEISKNISGLRNYAAASKEAQGALDLGKWKSIAKTRYTNDKQITDHYAIIPTGQGLKALPSLPQTSQRVYEVIVRRFLSIFYPPAVYLKISLVTMLEGEKFFSSFKVLQDPGYLPVTANSFSRKKEDDKALLSGESGRGTASAQPNRSEPNPGSAEEDREITGDASLLQALTALRKGSTVPVRSLGLKEGETSPPKRYNSGSMILAMENAGQLIEDEELRAQIKGSGIGTSATRAEILKKLFNIRYLDLNKKTQIISPTLLGEMVYDVVDHSIRQLLNPELTASWEKGLTYVAEGTITEQEYMQKLERFVSLRTNQVRDLGNAYQLRTCFENSARFYSPHKSAASTAKKTDA